METGTARPAVFVGEHDAPHERMPSLQRLVDECGIDLREAQLRAAEVLDAPVRTPPVPTEAKMAIVAVLVDERAAEVATILDLPNRDIHRPLGLRRITGDQVDRSRSSLQRLPAGASHTLPMSRSVFSTGGRRWSPTRAS